MLDRHCHPEASAMPQMPKRSLAPLAPVLALLLTGCAVHYYDRETGTEHILGFGHMKMKATAPIEGIRTVVRATEVVGISLGNDAGTYYLTLGWDARQNLVVLHEDTSVRLEWPSASLFRVRVGSEFPDLFRERMAEDGGRTK